MSAASTQLPCSPKRIRIGIWIVAIGPLATSSASNSNNSLPGSSRRLQICTIQPSPSCAVLWRGMKHGSCRLETGPHPQSCSAPLEDRESVVEGKRGDLGGRRIIKKKKEERVGIGGPREKERGIGVSWIHVAFPIGA